MPRRGGSFQFSIEQIAHQIKEQAIMGQFDGFADLQLAVDVAFDGLELDLGDGQGGADLPLGEAEGQKPQNNQFAIAQNAGADWDQAHFGNLGGSGGITGASV